MKFFCQKELLINNINLISKIGFNRTTLPILECVLLIVDKNGLKMISNNLELGIETSYIKVNVEKEGAIALESKTFLDIIRKLPDNNKITIYTENNLTTIRSGKVEFKLSGQPDDEFPLLPIIEKYEEYKISKNEFKNMIKKTIFSVSLNDSKPILTGELIEIEGNQVTMVAVDNFRVSLKSTSIKTKNKNIKCVVPGKSLNEISKILSDEDDYDISLYFTDKHILLETEEYRIVSRTLEGDFLDYKSIFTEEYKTIVYIDKQDILLSLERSSLISRDNKKIFVKLKIDKDILTITSETDISTFYDEVDVEMCGDEINIAFNPKYLIDAIKSINTEKISMQFNTPLSPCIIKGYNTEIYKYLVLPLRLKI